MALQNTERIGENSVPMFHPIPQVGEFLVALLKLIDSLLALVEQHLLIDGRQPVGQFRIESPVLQLLNEIWTRGDEQSHEAVFDLFAQQWCIIFPSNGRRSISVRRAVIRVDGAVEQVIITVSFVGRRCIRGVRLQREKRNAIAIRQGWHILTRRRFTLIQQ